MHIADQYSYSVTYSPEDEVFVGRVVEWPSLAAHGPTLDAALLEIRTVVASCLEDMAEGEEPPPEPLSKRSYSGKLLVRMPVELHRQLATEAEREGTSLNQLITTRLSAGR